MDYLSTLTSLLCVMCLFLPLRIWFMYRSDRAPIFMVNCVYGQAVASYYEFLRKHQVVAWCLLRPVYVAVVAMLIALVFWVTGLSVYFYIPVGVIDIFLAERTLQRIRG